MSSLTSVESLYVQLGRVRRGKKVGKKLDEVADKLAARAKDLGDAGAAAQIGREDGIRPAGRPYARVTASAAHEFGTHDVVRQRLLGRAVAEFPSGSPDTSE